MSPLQALRRALALIGAAAILFVAIVVAARAQPPARIDPALAPWFKSLTNPVTGISCCRETDGHVFDDSRVREVGNDYEALIAGHWVKVPARAVLNRIDNPTGGWAIFYPRGLTDPHLLAQDIYCFVRPAMT